MITKVDDNDQYEVVVTYKISGKDVNEFLKTFFRSEWSQNAKSLLASVAEDKYKHAAVHYATIHGVGDKEVVVRKADTYAVEPAPIQVYKVSNRVEITRGQMKL